MDKLDYLAQQEEQLRKLNDQLDAKKTDLMKNVDQEVNEPEKKDIFKNDAWTFKEPTPAADLNDSLEND